MKLVNAALIRDEWNVLLALITKEVRRSPKLRSRRAASFSKLSLILCCIAHPKALLIVWIRLVRTEIIKVEAGICKGVVIYRHGPFVVDQVNRQAQFLHLPVDLLLEIALRSFPFQQVQVLDAVFREIKAPTFDFSTVLLC